MLQDYYQKASGKKQLFIKLVILYGLAISISYLILRAYYINLNTMLAPLSFLLYIAEFHTILLLFGFLYSIWPRKYKVYENENRAKNLQVNLFITVCGEPEEIVHDTIKSAKKAADFYKRKVKPVNSPRVIVLNDGKAAKKDNWQKIKEIADNLGVNHVARETNEGFKAGNINNGLSEFPAKDTQNTIDCFFDADFSAKPEFVTEILKPLADNSVDFVQSPQRYKNLNTWVAKAAGAHQIFFFDYICPAKAYDNALFLCGTNYAIRRSALLEAKGVEDRFVTEDYATSIKLHLLGKKGVFVSKVLAEGYAPMNLKEYFNQQTRWCKGCLDANRAYLKDLLFGPLSIRQKLHYFLSTIYYFIGVRDTILVLAPLTFLLLGVSLVRANTNIYLALIYLPFVLFNFGLFAITFTHPLKSLVLDIVSFPVFAKAFLASLIGKNLPFSITIKKYERENPLRVYKTQLIIISALIFGLVYSLLSKAYYNPYGRYINYFWVLYSTSFLLTGFYFVIKENVNFRLGLDLNLPKLPEAYYRYSMQVVKAAVIILAAFGGGLSVPFIYQTGINIQDELAQKSLVVHAQDLVNSQKKQELIVPTDGVYYGYYLTSLNYHPENPEIRLIENESPTLAMYYQDWDENSGFDNAFMKKISDKGAVPVVTWEPFNSQKGSELNENGAPAKLILSGSYDEYIRTWAINARNYRKPFFLRFAHEMNGNWYPWANHGENSADDFIAMWRHVHSIFTEVGADNAIWVWSPNNTDADGITDGVLEYYPGDSYVDWVGFSAFNWGDSNWPKAKWRDFNIMTFEIYWRLFQLNKPIMVAETSSVSDGGDKTGWFYNTLSTYIPSMNNVKAVILFNEDVEGADFNLRSGMDVQTTITDNIVENDYYLKLPHFIYH